MWKSVVACAVLLCSAAAVSQEITADEVIRKAMDNYRGLTSHGQMSMTIHRTDWQREMAMNTWTEGDKRTLVRVTAPAKDTGNGTLSVDGNMWTYSPKVNRVIKVPASMMSQNWMGSDFSNKDVAKADDIIDQYDHSLLSVAENAGITIYEIQSVPHEDAAVVWGREVMRIRADKVVVEHKFYDQDDELVKELESLEIGEMGGRTIAIRQRMHKIETPDEWTEVQVNSVDYEIDIPDSTFTLSSLRNPRDM